MKDEGVTLIRYTISAEAAVPNEHLDAVRSDTRALIALLSQGAKITEARVDTIRPVIDAKFVSGIFYKAE